MVVAVKYIGMSYQQVYKQTIVWVTNRDEPVSDMFISVLKISDGNLVLYETPVWSTGLNSSSAHEAVLLDDGNLVLRDGSGSVLWQSFDHPFHVTRGFPEPESGTTNRPSLFSLELDESTAYKVLWNWPWSRKDWDLKDYSGGCVRKSNLLECYKGET
ncbi:hypothetical protein BRARA_F03453 [Brassica rapa]|uniref:Bulb-type lectin domain-containing protein n=1 Tax=Brassica campestris TaxID=3711 RepID=A0A397Z3K6_BRACM|nr:hypothetical protein BRARA_F03453 [Brassica rapa]